MRMHPCLGVLVVAASILGATPARADIVINEIMYNSAGPDTEFVEITNTGSVPVDLSGWTLKDDDDGHAFVVPVGNVLDPGAFLVFCEDTSAVAVKYGPGLPLIGNLTFGFGNTTDAVRLFNGASVLVDIVEYTDAPPWPPAADGTGPSLELLNPLFDNAIAGNWAASIVGTEGTPGAQNSVFTSNEPPTIASVTRSVPLPMTGDDVTIRARAYDDTGLVGVNLYLDEGGQGTYVPMAMFDDGLHDDGAAADSIYGVEIGAFPSGTLVRYYVWASDGVREVTSPSGAPLDWYGYTVDYTPPSIAINEIVADNLTGIADGFGEREDWIEITNRGNTLVDLGGMFLSDDAGESRMWQLPPLQLSPGAFLLFWADGEPNEGALHTSFRLSASGEEVILFDTVDHGNTAIDHMTFGLQNPDVAFGYFPEDSATAPEYLATPTPGGSNDVSSLFSPICINEFQTTSAAGGNDDWIELHNRGVTAVDIGGWFLSDDAGVPQKYAFPSPTILQPGAFVAVFENVLGFGMSSTGDEVIMLTAADGTTGQDYYDFGIQVADVSEGRYPDGEGRWFFFPTTTPGSANQGPLVGVDDPVGPSSFTIIDPVCIVGVSPNPSRHAARLRFDLAVPGLVRFSVLDVSGRRVQGYEVSGLSLGSHEIVWDGRSDTGAPVASGVYFLRVEAGGDVAVRSIRVVR